MKPAQLKERNYQTLAELSSSEAAFLTTVLDDYSYTLTFQLLLQKNRLFLRAHLNFYPESPQDDDPREQLTNTLITFGWGWVQDTLLFRKDFKIEPTRPGLLYVDSNQLNAFFGMYHDIELGRYLRAEIQGLTHKLSPIPSFLWNAFNLCMIVYYETKFGSLVETELKRSRQCIIGIPLEGCQPNYKLQITWDIAPNQYPVNCFVKTKAGGFYVELIDTTTTPYFTSDYELPDIGYWKM
jgi:hypothetical protein